MSGHDGTAAVRLDQWLWAARFFRTRALARAAIDGGKVHCGTQRCKPSRSVHIGDTFSVRQDFDERTVTVTALCAVRGSAREAAALYRETDDSLQRRSQAAQQRRDSRAGFSAPATRPGKHQRQRLQRLQRQGDPG